MAQTTQGLGLQVFDFATDSTPSFVNGVAGLTNSNMHKIDEAVTNKVKIRGETRNVNFIENEIVKDGLVTSSLPSSFDNSNEDFTVYVTLLLKVLNNASIIMAGSSTVGGWQVTSDSNGNCSFYVSNGSKNINKKTLESSLKIGYNTIIVMRKKEKITFIVNEFSTISDCTEMLQVTTSVNIRNENNTSYPPKHYLQYNKNLTPQEIAHNFSVLNNTSSINKINDYTISTDTDHVSTTTGVTEEERYTELLKTTCKEFTSNGEAITVNNGIPKQKVLSGVMQGQTIKNYITQKPLVAIWDSTVPIKSINQPMFLNANQYYWCCVDVPYFQNGSTRNEIDLFLRFTYSDGTSDYLPKLGLIRGVGRYIFKFSRPKDCVLLKDYDVTTQTLVDGVRFTIENIGIYDFDVSNIIKNIEYGLNSTQATIYNNGQKYTYYEPTINGKTRVMKATKGTQNWMEISVDETRDTTTYDYKLESVNGDLGSTPSAYDYIDRARKVKVFNTKEVILNGSEGWGDNGTGTEEYHQWYLVVNDIVKNSSIYVDKMLLKNTYQSYIYIYSSMFMVSIPTGIKPANYFTSNPTTVRYKLATPIEIPMTDAEIAQYDTYRQVIDLGAVGDARDTFEIKEDGSAVYTQNTKERIVNGSENWILGIQSQFTDTHMYFACDSFDSEIKSASIICDKFKNSATWNATSEECIDTIGSSLKLRIRIAKSKLTTLDVSGFKAWLQTNPVTICYQLATPIITTIPKELVPTILTQATNTFTFGEDVMATKATISVPVDKISEMEKQIATLALNMSTLTCDFITHANEL